MRFFQTLFSNIWRGISRTTSAIAYFFWKNKKFALLSYAGLALNIISWGILFWLYSAGRSGLVIHYNAFLGIDIFRYLGEGPREIIDVFITPLGGLCFYFINLIISISLLLLSPSWIRQDKMHQNLPIKEKKVAQENIDVYLFGIYMVIAGNIIIQSAILVYTVSIFLVNQ